MKRKNWLLAALVGLLASITTHAGTSNLDRLDIQPDAASGDVLRILDNAGNEQAVFEEDGTFDLSGASDVNLGSVVLSNVTSKAIWLPASMAGLGGSADPAVELKNNKFTYAFADATTDDEVFYSFRLPDDFDATNSSLWVSVTYLCDQATPTEGEWEIDLLGVADDDADAALGTAVEIHDTSPAQDDWSVTSQAHFAASGFSAGDVVTMRVLHDVDDPFCSGSAVNLLGVTVTYTTDTNK